MNLRQLGQETSLQAQVGRGADIFLRDDIASLTISKAQESKQFSLIKKENGEEYLQFAISKIMKEAMRFLPSKMNADDIVYFSKYFSKNLWHWKFDDFILCFKNGIEKKYGEIYGEFNMSVLMKWVEKYEQEKDDYFYNAHLDKKSHGEFSERNSNKLKDEQSEIDIKTMLEKYKK